jgi:ribosomal protein L27
MADSSDVEIILTLQDPEADQEALEALVQGFYDQLAELAEQVDRVPVADLPADSEYLPKGDKSEAGILDIKINLSQLQAMGKWLYERLVGTGVEATVKYKPDGEVEFSYKGKNQKDLSAYTQEVQQFVKDVEAAKRQSKIDGSSDQ